MERLGSDEHPCTSLPEAKRLLRERRNQADKTEITSSKKTLKSILNEYKAVMPFRDSTRQYKVHYLELFEGDFPPGKKIAELKKSDILKFLSKFEDRSSDTRNKALTAVRDLFRYAIDDQAIAVSPADSIKYKRSQATIKRPIPSWEDFEAIVHSVRTVVFSDTGKDSADLIEFMGKAGLGQAECAGMTWGDINFKTGKITIIRKKTGTEFEIPIYPQVRTLLERMDEERQDRSPDTRVFKVRDPKKGLDAACKRLELPNYSARAFRRMFITRCLELGIDPQTVASWQGHRDGGQLILKVYGRVSKKHQDEMATRLTTPTTASNIDPTNTGRGR
jgi:integrase